MADAPVDARFLLANERTFLAYVRTALSLQAAGLAVLQFLTEADQVVRSLLGVTLVVAGSCLGVAGFLRYRSNERGIRAGTDVGSAQAASVVAVAVAVLPLLAVLALALR
jgi:putative membrane protein